MSVDLYDEPQVVYVIRVFGGYLSREHVQNPNNKHGLQRVPVPHPAQAKWFDSPKAAADAARAVQGVDLQLCMIDEFSMSLRRRGSVERFQ